MITNTLTLKLIINYSVGTWQTRVNDGRHKQNIVTAIADYEKVLILRPIYGNYVFYHPLMLTIIHDDIVVSLITGYLF